MATTAAGYSGTPLPQKLGIKAGARVALVAAPASFALELPDGAELVGARGDDADVIVWFVTARAELEKRLGAVRARMKEAGGAVDRVAEEGVGGGDRHDRGRGARAGAADGARGQQGVRHRRHLERRTKKR